MSDTASPEDLGHVSQMREFFDRHYAAHDRYWWRGENRYSTDPAAHTPYNAAVLAAATRRAPGRALDLGAGEGADAIRVAVTSEGIGFDAYMLGEIPAERILSMLAGEALRLESYAAIGLLDPGEPVPAEILEVARALQSAGFDSRALS